jgi:hypothetical protein
MVYRKTKEELEEALGRQIGHLRRSCASYDAGELSEGERLAATCYILLHDGVGRQKSLLGQLGLKSKMRFVDSDQIAALKRNGLPTDPLSSIGLPLVSIHLMENSALYVPFLGSTPFQSEAVTFSHWWEGEIYKNASGVTLTRKNLVFFLRSQDGGAHVDDHLRDEAYKWLATAPDERVKFLGNGRLAMSMAGQDQSLGSGVVVKNAHWASMRQIAWEVDQSLKSAGLWPFAFTFTSCPAMRRPSGMRERKVNAFAASTTTPSPSAT